MTEKNRPAPGLRQRKKARIRRALADAALRLFLERGYDAVTVAEIADAADVSVPTLFSYFRSKEALLFDLEPEIDAGLVAAVRQRSPGRDVLDAVQEYLMSLPTADPREREQFEAFLGLVHGTPALRVHWQQMWLRHADTLADALAADRGLETPDLRIRAVARFIIDAVMLVTLEPDPPAALADLLALLRSGLDAAGLA
ncbi:TetR/AcrR family transcriptional regulator [Streptomyces sp. NBC_00557]|uniref:TetR/AcrR family transcriptional regulator n=1 Tax=Streptomyces sp. NBC_00557 TaxID=2975776 RepID=UPI002E801FBE|nr:helix-turn-helix domain-containing protein [Streptomyces sp. NBC_00557]WUC38614.1 TetR/AcrR family transcriptional regulator [Streptomyces sp. NBC_00557]